MYYIDHFIIRYIPLNYTWVTEILKENGIEIIENYSCALFKVLLSVKLDDNRIADDPCSKCIDEICDYQDFSRLYVNEKDL